VPRGIIFDKDTYIPVDAITHRTDGRVYVNIPKLVVGKLPWAEPPTSTSTAEKRGPNAHVAGPLYRSHQPTGPRG
jgi:hypothetical protein